MDLKIPDFTKDIDLESTPLKNIEKASTETAVQGKKVFPDSHIQSIRAPDVNLSVFLASDGVNIAVVGNCPSSHILTASKNR